MLWSRKQGGVETTVVTAFYTLIFVTGALRSIWFLIPNDWLKSSYTPSAVFAFSDNPWVGSLINSLLSTFGSLSLFFIFILILVYWADILKKYFLPGVRRSKPMDLFIQIAGSLLFIEGINYFCFFMKLYSSEGMILFNSIVLAVVSIFCVVKITMFSQRFSTVLKTLGDLNQVSTESQVKRIRWITVTGNLFFFLRAFFEVHFDCILLYHYYQTGNVDAIFTHKTWDTYVLTTHITELMILFLVSLSISAIFSIDVCLLIVLTFLNRRRCYIFFKTNLLQRTTTVDAMKDMTQSLELIKWGLVLQVLR